MLDEYIMEQLRINDEKFVKLNEKLQRLQMEEESCNHMIETLLENEDVGIEFFSPRSSEDSTRIKVSRIKEQIDSIRLQQASITDEISEVKKQENQYQEMLLETREKKNLEQLRINENDAKPPISANANSGLENEKEELKKILKRIDKCLNLLNTNKTQCKNEMINLKYYLKALISNQ